MFVYTDSAGRSSVASLQEGFPMVKASSIFFVGDHGVERCRESQRMKVPIAITGLAAINEPPKLHKGTVLSVEEIPTEYRGRRWRITMR
jgi:hypothetical protein